MADRFNSPEDAALLGARMRVARKRQGFTLKHLAAATKVDAGQLSRFERGRMATLSPNVLRICKFLQINPVVEAGAADRTRALLEHLLAQLPGREAPVERLLSAIQEIVRGGSTYPGPGNQGN
ncbi:helix-turn-helix domain-containing protein [Pseudoxanthomonas suwonensis]|jgi:Predicted transcriptional regulators|uniref:helix-turn-helix domain-containing protein n=1 Tax=Pseudoxanthomonas suwonensis TaxID=314722 RepID=UPI00138F2B30|nr:hypothetical protein CSC68_05200 [Pseudoxanthomonas suwonensis]